MEKIDASSANSFTVDERLLLRSFMYIRKNNGPKIEPWGTPASIGDHEDIDHSIEHVEIYLLRKFQWDFSWLNFLN